MSEQVQEQDHFAGMNKVRAKKFDFGAPGDWAKGTLLGRKTVDTQYGPKNVYEFKALVGSYHPIDSETKQVLPTVETLIPGEMYSFFGKPVIDDKLKYAKNGQIFAMKFVGSKPSKKGNPSKDIDVFLGEMDPNHMGEMAEDVMASNWGTGDKPAA